MSSGTAHPRGAIDPGQRRALRPVLFVIDCDPGSLDVLLADLSRRFGNDFTVTGDTSPEAALSGLAEMARSGQPVALLLVDDDAADLLERSRELHPRAKRVLLVDRDYSSTSPAVQAMTLGHADYHLVRPWMDDELMYRAMSEYLSSWTHEHEPNFELFRIVAQVGDGRVRRLRDVMTRFSMPFGFYARGSRAGRQLLHQAGLDAVRLPVVIRHGGQAMVDPSLPISPAPLGPTSRTTSMSAISPSSARAQPAWPQPSTPRPRASTPCCLSNTSPAARPVPAR